ncbi:MAG: type III-B CRISPR module RAMP protein Cmr1 [Candidatus Aenigmatarchaeota archaeon]
MGLLKLRCKVITPMFMTGADGRTPELRPSEFKGMMRWWWRAIKAEDDIKELKKNECEIFGGTGEGMGKSKVKIKINTALDDFDIIDYQPLPHHRGNNCPVDNQSRCRKAFTLKAIKPGKEIEIEFSIPSLEIQNLIFLTFILGGFGKRSRRGFGSLHIINPEIKIDLENILQFLNGIENIYEINNSSINSAIKAIRNRKGGSGNYPWIKEIILGNKEFNNSDEILKNIGMASHNHSDPSLGYANPRMASPVYVSVVEIQNRLRPIITLLNSSFPQNYPRWNISKQINFIKELVL